MRPLRLEWPAFSGRPRQRPWPQRPRSPPPSLPSSQPRRLNDESWPIPHALGRATLTQLPACRCHGPEQVCCVTVAHGSWLPLGAHGLRSAWPSRIAGRPLPAGRSAITSSLALRSPRRARLAFKRHGLSRRRGREVVLRAASSAESAAKSCFGEEEGTGWIQIREI